jgi:D-alanyl-D-alanine carboxypeptidase/D-alanyl-D-alanine-endopeptidase (penicillin-binding protein 4)
VPDGVVSPITPLWVDEGRPSTGFGRVDDPALSAATVFAGALARSGIKVAGIPAPRAARPGARELTSVSSAPLSEIVERILDVSDNEAAEVLFRQVGLAGGGDGSSASAQAAVRSLLAEQGIGMRGSVLYDGSGLSREDRMDPRLLVDVIRAAADPDHPDLRAVVTGLPVAGFTGSLAERFEEGDPDGRGRVRAKTGTLTGVSGLAGIAQDLDGDLLVFVMLADKVALEDTLDARDALDDAAAALGGCRCG